MKIDFSAVISDIKGTALIWRQRDGAPILADDGKPSMMTLRSICNEALLGTYDEDRTATGDAKLKRFKLAMKINETNIVDLKVEEITEIKNFIAKAFGPLVIGRCYDLLDPDSEAPSHAPKTRPTAVG